MLIPFSVSQLFSKRSKGGGGQKTIGIYIQESGQLIEIQGGIRLLGGIVAEEK